MLLEPPQGSARASCLGSQRTDLIFLGSTGSCLRNQATEMEKARGAEDGAGAARRWGLDRERRRRTPRIWHSARMEIFARGLELEFGKAVASASWGAGGFLAVRGVRSGAEFSCSDFTACGGVCALGLEHVSTQLCCQKVGSLSYLFLLQAIPNFQPL